MGAFFKVVLALFVITALQSQLFAYSDKDLDGVDDSRDRCPDSSMEDLVDATGCVPKTGITLALGGSQSSGDYGTSGTITSETRDIQLSYISGGWYASAATSYLESGMGDTYLGIGYTVLGSAWSFGVQGVVKLPTADEDIGTGNSDVGGYATLARLNGDVTLFTTVGYLITGDDADTEYNDIPSLTIGAGKSIGEHLFASLSAAHADALVDGLDPSRTLSLFLAYRLDGCWFLNASYANGLSDSVADHTFSLMGGYNF